MSVRDIQGQLQEMYGVEVSPTLISNVTDALIDEVKQWQNRPLDAVYPIVFLDCLVIKVRGRTLSHSLLSRPRFAEQFTPPMRLSR
ncbi:MAG TPA: hypothetical protein DCZ88_00970 [Pseudanabaena sp.]|nr:hypothetical protein [Pseudanabaena sp.]